MLVCFDFMCLPNVSSSIIFQMVVTCMETVKFVGYSAFEILLQVLGFLAFSLLLCFKIENVFGKSWWYVFSPLFASDAVTFYFSVIVYIRFSLSKKRKEGNRRQAWIMLTLFFVFLFKMLLCGKLEGNLSISYAQLISPLFCLWTLYFLRACKLK